MKSGGSGPGWRTSRGCGDDPPGFRRSRGSDLELFGRAFREIADIVDDTLLFCVLIYAHTRESFGDERVVCGLGHSDATYLNRTEKFDLDRLDTYIAGRSWRGEHHGRDHTGVAKQVRRFDADTSVELKVHQGKIDAGFLVRRWLQPVQKCGNPSRAHPLGRGPGRGDTGRRRSLHRPLHSYRRRPRLANRAGIQPPVSGLVASDM